MWQAERDQLSADRATAQARMAALESSACERRCRHLRTTPGGTRPVAPQLAVAKSTRGARRAGVWPDPYHGQVADVIGSVTRASNIQLTEESLKVVAEAQETMAGAMGHAPSWFEITNLAWLWLGVSLQHRDPGALAAALAPYRGRLKPRSLGPVLRALWQYLLDGR